MAVAALNRELFVRYSELPIEVYDVDTFALLRRLPVECLKWAASMTSCRENQCIYIADSGNCVVHRIDGLQNQQTKWSVADRPRGISLGSEYNVIVASNPVQNLTVSTTYGELVREINLQHPNIYHLVHAVQLSMDDYVVCHSDLLHTVIIVDGSGHIKKSFGGNRAAAHEQFFTPSQLALVKNGFIGATGIVNKRLVMLSNTLEYVKGWSVGGGPKALWFDKKTDRLFVGVNEMNDECEYLNGHIEIYSLS